MARILFIRTFQESEFFDLMPPVGVMYLAGLIRERRPEDTIRIVDMRLERMTPEEVGPIVRELAPTVIGLSALSYEEPMMHATAEVARREAPAAHICLGGPLASASAQRLLAEDKCLDSVAVGEGEYTMVELLDALDGHRELASVNGIGFRLDDGALHFTPERELEQNLDVFPIPAWDLIDIEAYFNHPMSHHVYTRRECTILTTSRGCPFKCSYCHNVFGKRFRGRSPQNVVDEIEHLVREFGVTEFKIMDDIFNYDIRRAKAICREIIDRNLDIRFSFPNGLRADQMDEELLSLLKQAGAFWMAVAVETASPRLQKMIRKYANLKKTEFIINTAAKYGIMTHGFFMLGFPTETREELESTIAWARRSRLHTASFFIVNAFEGSKLYDQAVAMGLEVDINKHSYYRPTSKLAEVGMEELETFKRRANRGFYFRPSRILRILRDLPRKTQLLNYAWWVARRSFA